MKKHFFIIFALLISLNQLSGATYYVDCVNGSDFNSGDSWANAAASIQKAVNTCTNGKGNTIYVAASIQHYTGAGSEVIYISKSGASTSNMLEIISYPTNGLTNAVINCQNLQAMGFNIDTRSFIRISGFKFINGTEVGVRIFNSPNANIIVANNYFSNFALNGIKAENSSDVIMKSNTCCDINENGIFALNSSHIMILNNTSYSSRYHGIKIEGSPNSVVFRNISYNNSERGIHFISNSTDCTCINNTVYNNNFYNGIMFESSSTGGICKNNIAYGNTGEGINFDPSSAAGGYICDYNCAYNNTGANFSHAGANNIEVDPLFISGDPASADFLHLNDNSPCIDKGDPADPVPSGGGLIIDIGAIEWTFTFIGEGCNANIYNFSATGDYSEVQLNWDTANSENITHYNIYRSLYPITNTNNKASMLIGVSEFRENPFTDLNIDYGKAYYYAVEGSREDSCFSGFTITQCLCWQMDASGGTVYGPNMISKIEVPQNALAGTITLCLKSGDLEDFISMYRIEPLDQTFNKLVKITLKYPGDAYDNKDISVYYYNGMEWIKIGGEKDTSPVNGGTIEFHANHGGEFAVGTGAPENKSLALQDFPFSPNNDGKFDTAEFLFYLEEQAQVQFLIYDLNGQLVKILLDDVKPAGRIDLSWDGRGMGDDIVDIGPYIYQILIDDEVFKNGVIVVTK